MTEDYYKFSAIRLTPEQVQWCLIHLRMMEQGVWPPECVETGKGSLMIGCRAMFENAAIIAAEINLRVSQCGYDAKLAYNCLSDGWDILDLADHKKVEPGKLWNKILRVCRYASGPCARWLPCQAVCERYDHCRRKDRATQNYSEFCQHRLSPAITAKA